jgi:hypothetical protein
MAFMPRRALLALLTVCALLLPVAPARAAKPLVVQGLGRDLIPLNAGWQFHTGDNPAWASPTLDDSAWEPIAVTRPWGVQGHFAYTGYAWYRLHLEIQPIPGVTQTPTLDLPPIAGPYQVFWNGNLIGQTGRMPPHPIYAFRGPPHSFGLPTASGVLAIRIWSPPLHFLDAGENGGLASAPTLGTANAIAAYLGNGDHIFLRDRQYYFDVNLLYGLIAILSFLAWLPNRRQTLLLWVALFALSQPVHVALFNARFPFHATFAYGFNQLVIGLRDISLWFLLLDLLELDDRPQLRRWARILAAVVAASALLDWFAASLDWSSPHTFLYQVVDGIVVVPISLAAAYPAFLVFFALRKRLNLANWLVAASAFALETISVLAISSLQGQRFTHWYRFYDALRFHLFSINGNYFDPESIATTLLLLSILYAVSRYATEQSQRKGALEQEFKNAQELQRILVPESLPPLPGYAITSAYHPAQEVGGDFFQLIALPGDSALLVLGDVSGKGLKAAMTVSLLVGTLRTLAETTSDPAQILTGLNRRLVGRLDHGFVTCLALRLEPDGTCLLANAGHLPPFLNHAEITPPPSLPLGLTQDIEFENTTLPLQVGDRLTLYTDGLLEARKPTGELFGFDRLQTLLATQPDAHQASQSAIDFGQDDDITVLTLTRLPLDAQSTTHLTAPTLLPAPA